MNLSQRPKREEESEQENKKTDSSQRRRVTALNEKELHDQKRDINTMSKL
jgi:hypothetical protein